MLVSSTDRDLAKLLNAPLSKIPERYGVDVIESVDGGLLGVQRKEIYDLLASVADGRLQRELVAMNPLMWKMLIIEGRLPYTTEGNIIDDHYKQWTRTKINNLLRSVAHLHECPVERVETMQETAQVIKEFIEWANRGSHRGLLTRSKRGVSDEWGSKTYYGWCRYFLQGFDGIGSATAESILDQFGRMPLGWTVSEEELRTVDGIGALTAKRLYRALNPDEKQLKGWDKKL